MTRPIKNIAVIGADLHTWTVALGLTAALRGQNVSIYVVGQSVAMQPDVLSLDVSAHAFHRQLGLEEATLVAELGASYRYGTSLSGFGARQPVGQESIYSYSPTSEMLNRVDFHHYIATLKSHGVDVALQDYSLTAQAALQGRFSHPTVERGLAKIDYNMQLDKLRYLAFLKRTAINNGVRYIEQDVTDASLNNDGAIVELLIGSNQSIAVDFVFDCDGVIFDQVLEIDFQDCSANFPINRTLTWVAKSDDVTPVLDRCEKIDKAYLQTRSLQGGLGYTLSYDDSRLDDSQALNIAHQKTNNLDQHLLSYSALKCGYRTSPWVANAVAMGSVAGSVGDMIFNSLFHTQSALQRWLELYPTAEINKVLATQYNRMTVTEFERVLDVHGFLFSAGDQDVSQTETLKHRIALFSATGNVAFYEDDVLEKQQWVNLFLACEIWPVRSDAMLSDITVKSVKEKVARVLKMNQELIAKMPSLDDLLNAIRKAA